MTSSQMDISFEFFPPKTDAGLNKLIDTANRLNTVDPSYFSVTYGAGGSTQESTMATVSRLQQAGFSVTPHITCIGTTKATIAELLTQYQQLGITQLVCLRGDLPFGKKTALGDFSYAAELVRFIRETTGSQFHIEVAVYPEAHPESSTMQQDLTHFKAKVDAGADGAISQYFFDANAYYQLREDCSKLNITIPITPGIIPITNSTQLIRFSDRCGADIPRWIKKRLESFGDDSASLKAFGLDVISRLCQQLINYGAPGLHFYTINQAQASIHILQQLSNTEAHAHVNP